MTKLCEEHLFNQDDGAGACSRIAGHEGEHDRRERPEGWPDKRRGLGELCGRMLADGSLCTRYRGYRKGLADLPHEGACDSGERAWIEQERPVDLPLAYLDLETSGISLSCSTIQAAIVLPPWSRFDGGEPRSFDSFMRPTSGPLMVEPEAMAYNDIDLRKSAQWPTQADVARDMRAWAGEQLAEGIKMTACGFNVRFDIDRLALFCPGLFRYRVVDLTSVALFHGLPGSSKDLIDRFGDPAITARHDALADARQAAAVHAGMMRHLAGKGDQ